LSNLKVNLLPSIFFLYDNAFFIIKQIQIKTSFFSAVLYFFQLKIIMFLSKLHLNLLTLKIIFCKVQVKMEI